MNLVIETDCGADPDDFFTICYLVATGVKVKSIVSSPGNLDQLAVVRFLSEELGLDVPIGCHKNSNKYSAYNGFHHKVLKRYGKSVDGYADGFGKDIIKIDDCQVLVIGPPSNIGRYLEEGKDPPKKLMMQGGFLPYHFHGYDVEIVDKFDGKDYVPTFNMNGDRPGTLAILGSKIEERRFCGKNLCHTILMMPDRIPNFKPKNRASELFVEAAKMLFDGDYRHEKKFHDPVAACCMLHPEIGTWVRGVPVKMGGGWSTELKEDGDYVLADIDRESFWERMYTFS